MRIPFLDLKKQYGKIGKEIREKMEKVLDSGWFILGEEGKIFERKFAGYLNADHCVTVNSGTDALELALRSLGVGAGDQVITSSNTFIATVLAISRVGAEPILVDIEDDYQISPREIEKHITPKTKAIIAVHLYGMPADINQIVSIARKNKLFLIEDACQAHGAAVEGKKVGTFGDLGCFSFYPGKNLGAYGDGGAVVTNSKKLAEKMLLLRNYGQKVKYEHEILGINSRLDELQAAVLSVKLKYLDEWNNQRAGLARAYRKNLSGVKGIILPPEEDGNRTFSHHLFVIRAKKRNKLQKHLLGDGIQTMIHYPIPVHRQKAYRTLNKLSLPKTDKFSGEILSLPLYPELKIKDVTAVANSVKKFYA